MRRDEQLGPTYLNGRLDLLRRPLAEPEVSRLALRDDLLQRLDRFLDRYRSVEPVRLVEVDVVSAQSRQGSVDLLGDLRS